MSIYRPYLIILYPKSTHTPEHYYVNCRHKPQQQDIRILNRYFNAEIEVRLSHKYN